MDWYDNVFELIDMRSFSNLWFWIMLAIVWSTTSHRVLGIPWDMALRARRGKTQQCVTDFEDMVRINTNRILYIFHESGVFMFGFTCFLLTVMCLVGFVYHKEFAQALFLMGFPMSIVLMLSIRTATKIHVNRLAGEALFKQLHRHRMVTQVIGVISIFVTGMWGMLQNMTVGILGG